MIKYSRFSLKKIRIKKTKHRSCFLCIFLKMFRAVTSVAILASLSSAFVATSTSTPENGKTFDFTVVVIFSMCLSLRWLDLQINWTELSRQQTFDLLWQKISSEDQCFRYAKLLSNANDDWEDQAREFGRGNILWISDCRSFTVDKCSFDDAGLFETINELDEETCQMFCENLFGGQCKLFIVDRKHKICQLFNQPSIDFVKTCKKYGGPRWPEADSCKNSEDLCDVRIIRQ
jgi:hypothetical protein